MAEKGLFRNGLKIFFGLLLLHASSSAFAFTLIEIPESTSAPGSTITDATTFDGQIRPVTSAIRNHIRDSRRRDQGGSSAQRAELFASNVYASTMSDADFIPVSGHAGGGDLQKSLWLSSSYTRLENDFSRTRYDGQLNALLVGFDVTRSDRYVFGISASIESSDIDTDFNLGNQEIDGYSINPYFAYLISDAWSVDLSLGIGSFDTEQFRTIGEVNPAPPPLVIASRVDSDFSTDRDFLSTNLTWSAPRGRWYLTGWLGYLAATSDQEGYTESDATEVEGQELDFERWSVGGEAAWGRGNAETYIGLIYEKDMDVNEVEFPTGEQPANDDDSVLLLLGWRYFGDFLVANIELSSRQEADDIVENSFATTLFLYL